MLKKKVKWEKLYGFISQCLTYFEVYFGEVKKYSFHVFRVHNVCNVCNCERTRSSFCVYISESSKTYKILKNGRRHFWYKPISIFSCPESMSKVDLARPRRSLMTYIWQYYRYGRKILTQFWFKFQNSSIIMRFSASLKFRQFSAVVVS